MKMSNQVLIIFVLTLFMFGYGYSTSRKFIGNTSDVNIELLMKNRTCNSQFQSKTSLHPVGQRFPDTNVVEAIPTRPVTTPLTTLSYRAKVSVSIYGVLGLLILCGTILDVILAHFVRPPSVVAKARTSPLEDDFVERQHTVTDDVTDNSLDMDHDVIGSIQESAPNKLSKLQYWTGKFHRSIVKRLSSIKNRILAFRLKDFCKRFILCFSLYSNGSKLLNTKQGTGTLRAINGIRFFSMTWVILGHTLERCQWYSDNRNAMVKWVLERWTYQPMENATPSVDSFFTISGLLVSYLTMKELYKTGGKINWFMYYFHRYFRLTAPLGMMMLFVLPLFEYLGNGRYWASHRDYCQKTWYKLIFYVQNLDLDRKGPCMSILWYMSNDMQFYILTPFILLPLYLRPRIGVIVWNLFLLTAIITAGVISKQHRLGANKYQPSRGNRWNLYYMKPYCRMGPYLIGMAAGYFLCRTSCKLKLKWYVNSLLWSCAISTGLAVIYGLVESDQKKFSLSWDVAALYNALSTTAWGAGVSWLVVASATDNGGFVNSFLSWKPFVVLSRCSYMAYLLHPYTNEWFFSSRSGTSHLTDIGVVYRCFGSISLAFLVSMAASLVMEAPMLNIEALVFSRERRK